MVEQPSDFSAKKKFQTWIYLLFEPVDNSPLIGFRIIFGALLALEGWGAIATGWVNRVFVAPSFTFTFIGFEWLHPLLGPEMYVVYALLGLTGVMVMLGFYYRASMTVYALLWTLCYLMQKSSYNNHYYLMVLLCWTMVCMPAHRYFSLDVRYNKVVPSLSCSRWCLLFFVVQVSIVYFFAALAKLYPDWLALKPISLWFGNKAHYPIIGSLLQTTWVQGMVAYGGIAFDLLIVPFLLWKRSRPYAFVIAVFFHVFNSVIFGIGVFPYMMIGLSIFFFPPAQVRAIFFKNKPLSSPKENLQMLYRMRIIVILVIYFLFQLFLPIRHFFIQGDVFWTEEGHRMAWRMMLRSKGGSIQFKVKDTATGEVWRVDPYDELTGKQVSKLAVQPDMIWQFAQLLEQKYRQGRKAGVEVYAISSVSLNGDSTRPMVDSTVNLAGESWNTFTHARWILTYE